MTGTERVRNTILGLPTDHQPIYGWVAWNLRDQFAATWGSPEAFEDHYEFDAAHIFGHPCPYDKEIGRVRMFRGIFFSRTGKMVPSCST